MGVVSTGTIWAVGWQRLGMAVVTDAFRWAAFGLSGATTCASQSARVQDAICFIEGSGLDRVLDGFGIEADPTVIRYAFKRRLAVHEGPVIWSHWLLQSPS